MDEAQLGVKTKLRSTRRESYGPFGSPGAAIAGTFSEYSTWHFDISVLNYNLNYNYSLNYNLNHNYSLNYNLNLNSTVFWSSVHS